MTSQMEAELAEYRLQLETVEASLKANPENAELQTLADELKEIIALTETVIAEQNGGVLPSPQQQSKPSSSNSTPRNNNNSAPPPPPQSSSNAPPPPPGAFNYGAPAPPSNDPFAAYPPPPPSWKVGDQVAARWTSGDGSYYPARITSITGSSADPVYIVKFHKYNVTETLKGSNVKPLTGKDAVLSGGLAPGAPKKASGKKEVSSAVISQPANIDSSLAEQHRRTQALNVLGADSRGSKVQKKLKHGKELNEGKKKWLEFASKGVKMGGGVKRKIGETSMFRTPEGVHGRVGFTGSGQPMRKESNVRGKHRYDTKDLDE
ncbi:hypothetical protein BJ508DRAFT_326360 [Ascobolus immersus RN42]|uniref:Tudor domain-containing protein n=1 Tax=Ascobolus immersus RN42 TaxID=1160509 RepID=A0A3N4I5V4_ASCIM|nr:hypothetical protein BJ508DRAFT_326360 [Ascobolus immersus RN42]